MNIDQISESKWISVVQGTRTVQFEFLGLQMLIVSLRQRLRSKEISNQDCVRELKNYHNKYGRLPAAERDFNKIAN
jgi:hypothetical protein